MNTGIQVHVILVNIQRHVYIHCVKDVQHFLNVREDNHKFIEHLFMERLKFEAEMIEKLESEIDQLKSLTLRQCPNCGIRRPKRYHRSSQTPHYFYKRDLGPDHLKVN